MMHLNEFPDEQVEALRKATKVIVRKGSLNNDHSVNDAVLLAADSPMNVDQMDGYELGSLEQWFNLVAGPLDEEKSKALFTGALVNHVK